MERGLYETDIEKIMKQQLINLNFIPQFPIRGSYILDFAHPELKIAVECDGERWHPIGKIYDLKKTKFLERRGWKVVRFKGNDIKNKTYRCFFIVKLAVERRKLELENNKS